jgi:hypothetical protein
MTPDEFNAQEIAAGKLTQAMVDAATATGGIVAVQKRYGLTADGLAGAKTQTVLAALVAGKTPIPHGTAGVKAVYGDFAYTEGDNGRINIDQAWVYLNIVWQKLHTGQSVRLHAMVASEFAVLFAKACKASSYTPASVQTFVPRHTLWDPTKSLSLHSWGIAIDFSPSENTMGGTDGKGGQSKMRQNLSFVKAFTDAGWTWGGSWKMRDDMHFQRAG